MFTPDAYNYLHECTDKYYEIYMDKGLNKFTFPFEQYIENGDVYKSLFYKNLNPSYTQKVIFFAQTEYLLRVRIF